MLVKDGTAYRNVLLRSLTSLLNLVENKERSAAQPTAGTDAGAAGPGTGASPALAELGPGASAGPAAAPSRSCRKQTSSAVKPPAGADAGADAGTGGPGPGARPAVAAVGPGASASPAAAAVAASLQNAPLATAKHHATEGRKCLQKCAAPGLDVPSGSC